MLNRTFRFNFEKFQVNLAEILVFTGLFLWTVQIYFDDSGYLDLTGELPLKLIRYFCMLLFMGAIYFTEKSYPVKLAGAICLKEGLWSVLVHRAKSASVLVPVSDIAVQSLSGSGYMQVDALFDDVVTGMDLLPC